MAAVVISRPRENGSGVADEPLSDVKRHFVGFGCVESNLKPKKPPKRENITNSHVSGFASLLDPKA